ncbi:hypothetical protein ACOME3_007739 [Neoechinorhynchus agilis]
MSSVNPAKLRSLGIHNILNVACRELVDDVNGLRPLNGFEIPFRIKKLHVDDNEQSDLLSIVAESVYFIEQVRRRKQKVLVHCSHGQSRSPSIVLAYLMLAYMYPLERCLKEIKRCRPCVIPNYGFIRQLMFLESLVRMHGSHTFSYLRSQTSRDIRSEYTNSSYAGLKDITTQFSLAVLDHETAARFSMTDADREYISQMTRMVTPSRKELERW